MKITPIAIEGTAIEGPAIVSLEELSDDRGFFARAFCAEEFADAGLEPVVTQANLSFNHRAGTLRGMHYQLPEAPEAKFIRCIRGALVDVIVDVREGSPTYLQHVSVELSAENRLALYVPPSFAHGYLTLTDNCEAIYQMSWPYTPGMERGMRHDDPALGITWPRPVEVISAKDASWPLLAEKEGAKR